MADHVRTQLRDAVVTAVTGLATTGASVFASRVYAVQLSELPALLVYQASDEVVERTMHSPPTVTLAVEIVIRGVAKAIASLDDTLDTIAKEVQTALAGGVNISGSTVPVVYEGSETTLDGEGEKPTGQIEMRFTGTVSYAANAPDILTQ